MAVFPTHASLGQSALASLMALLSVESVHSATPAMGSHAKILMSAKRSRMLALVLTESIAVWTLSLVITVFPALHGFLVLNPSEEEWNRQLLKNRFGLLFICCGLGWDTHSLQFFKLDVICFRFALPVIHARMVATTAIKMQIASTWAFSPSPCSAVSAGQGMLGMAAFVEKTLIWMDGPTLIWCVWRTPLTIAKR